MFDLSSSDDGRLVLSTVRSNIEAGALEEFSKAGGFGPPNDFSFAELIRILDDGDFPIRNHYNLQWAIYECGVEVVRELSSWAKMFVCSVYLYCNKRRQWGMSVESDYFYSLTEEAAKVGGEYADVAAKFLAWLERHVAADVGYDNYFLLLAWLMVKRSMGGPADADVLETIDALSQIGYTAQQIDDLSVSVTRPPGWLALSKLLPPVPDVSEDRYDQIIMGNALEGFGRYELRCSEARTVSQRGHHLGKG
jgi:hypothetical protein